MKKNNGSDMNKDLNIREMFGIPLFGRDKQSLLSKIANGSLGSKVWVATVNPEFVMNALQDRDFMKILQSRTTMNVVDGIGLVWAKRVFDSNYQFLIFNFQLKILTRLITGIKIGVEILQGRHRKNLITGVELMDKLCDLAEKNNKTVFFYGGWGDRSRRTADFFVNKYPKLKVGYKEEDFDFNLKTDYLFVARGMKKQEEWIDDNFNKLKVELVMGVGRSFDYYSGDLWRAPNWIRKMGMEWLFSLIMEPKRWRRQLALPKFIWMVLTK